MVISHDREIVNQMKTRVLRMEKGKIISDTKGDYDTVKAPKTTPEEKKEGKEDKFKGLDKDVKETLEKAKITDMEMVLNLTESDLNNLKFKKEQKEELEKYVRNYLSKGKHD
jgi:ATPase subunit of ABC transporter with duplicated ATPase domains